MSTDELAQLTRRLQREREARKQAEHLLEERSRALYQSHQELLAQHQALREANERLEAMHLRLLEADKLAAIGQLAAGVAHEINTPLGVVRSNLQTLGRQAGLMLEALQAAQGLVGRPPEAADPAALQRWQSACRHPDWAYLSEDLPAVVGDATRGLDRVAGIVQDLRDFSRVGDAGAWQRVDLADELERVLRICETRWRDQAQLVREFDGVGEVECQPSRLNQVFIHLLTNACQALATPRPGGAAGTIWLRAGRDALQDEVWVEVEDSGPGIAPDLLNRIFEPFFTTRPVGQGSGLGLSQAWGIVQAHGGRLEVRSPPGRGACFRVSLPRVASNEAGAQAVRA